MTNKIQIQTKLASILMSLLSFQVWASQDPFEKVRGLPSFSVELPSAFCDKEFPFHKRVVRNLPSPNGNEKFSVFAFTTREFNPAHPSVLIVHGGPGGLWNFKTAEKISETFSEFNSVFFHYRGGGCSAFPSMDPELDRHIDSLGTIADMEGIRTAYGIKVWKSVVGFSYGTNVARMYSHFMANRMETLILEGLDEPGRRNREIMTNSVSESTKAKAQAQRVVDIIRNRYENSDKIKVFVPPMTFRKFIDDIFPNYLEQVPLNQNYFLLGFWDTYKPEYEKYYSIANQSLPRHFNRETFGAVTALAYINADSNADSVVVNLISQFVDIPLPEEIRRAMAPFYQDLVYSFFPYLNPDYLTAFRNSSLISQRVQMAMTTNDRKGSIQNLCTSVKTLVINGTVDSATPISNVRSYLNNKECFNHPDNLALVIEGGGHSNLSSMNCLSEFTRKFLQKRQSPELLSSCDLPVKIER